MKPCILLAEDEPGLILTLTDRLEAEGFDVNVVTNGELAVDRVKEHTFSIILLDVMMPKKNGFDTCRDIRALGIKTPILLLTAKGQIIDKVLGLKLGADDYLTKPFDMMELLARIEALIRRSQPDERKSSGDHFQFDEVVVNFRAATVMNNGELLSLTAQEFRLLKYFIEHKNAALSRDELLNEVWGYGANLTTRTVDVHVAWLRQKLEINSKVPNRIITVHGIGYKFVY